MENLVLIFPVGALTAAEAYRDWANDPIRNPVDDGDFCMILIDRYGQHVVGYLGPGALHGAVTEEPEGGEAMRSLAILASRWEPPADDI